MAALNQAKIIKALKKLASEPHEPFIFSFLSAYGIQNTMIKRLRMGDVQRNVAKISGDIVLTKRLYFLRLRMVLLLKRKLNTDEHCFFWKNSYFKGKTYESLS